MFFRKGAHQGGKAERKAMIDRDHKLSVSKQCRILKLSRSSVYYQPRPISEKILRLMRRIDELHLEYPFAGSRMLRAMLLWAEQNNVKLHFIGKGKPWQNGFVESFNGKFRSECLDLHLFESLDHAKKLIAEWREHYNWSRPHSSLGYRTPMEYKQLIEEKSVILQLA